MEYFRAREVTYMVLKVKVYVVRCLSSRVFLSQILESSLKICICKTGLARYSINSFEMLKWEQKLTWA